MTATLPPQPTPANQVPVPTPAPGMNTLVLQVLAVVAIVIVALSLSGVNSTVAKLIQGGLVIAIIAVLVRDAGNQNVFVGAFKRLEGLAISSTQ